MDVSDLTSRARTRNAALRQFAEHGFASTSLRSVAEAAGVSIGLVQHHFGSKARLIEACDAYAIEFVRRETDRGVTGQQLADADFLSDAYTAGPPIMAYLARALVDNSPGSAVMFDEMVAVAEVHLTPLDGVGSSGGQISSRTVAAVLTAMKLGITVFHGQLTRVLDLGDDAEAGWHEISKALLAIVGPALMGGGSIAELAGHGVDEYDATQENQEANHDGIDHGRRA
jgi:AcrR family transcriptional regulator